MSTSNERDKRRDDVFATLQSQSTRFDRELADVRMAINECYERSIGRLSDARWVPLEEVTRIVDELNAAPRDYYVLPSIDMTADRLRLAEQNGLSLDAYRFDTLDFFFSMAGRARFSEVA